MNRGHEFLQFVKLIYDIFEFLALDIQEKGLLIQTKALNETFLRLGLD